MMEIIILSSSTMMAREKRFSALFHRVLREYRLPEDQIKLVILPGKGAEAWANSLSKKVYINRDAASFENDNMLIYTLRHEIGHIIDKATHQALLYALFVVLFTLISLPYIILFESPYCYLALLANIAGTILILKFEKASRMKREHRANKYACQLSLELQDVLPVTGYLANLRLASEFEARPAFGHPSQREEQDEIEKLLATYGYVAQYRWEDQGLSCHIKRNDEESYYIKICFGANNNNNEIRIG